MIEQSCKPLTICDEENGVKEEPQAEIEYQVFRNKYGKKAEEEKSRQYITDRICN